MYANLRVRKGTTIQIHFSIELSVLDLSKLTNRTGSRNQLEFSNLQGQVALLRFEIASESHFKTRVTKHLNVVFK